MKSRSHHLARILTLAAVTTAAASWSTASYACTPEPYISAVCVLAWARNDLRGYAPAAGQLMPLNQNQVLFALLGTTYGGNGQTNFALPDLRGRTIIGAGTGGTVGNYTVGQVGGTPGITLTQANMPAHNHALAPVELNTVTAGLDLSKVANNTSSAALTGVTFNVDSSKLRVRANNSAANQANPNGNVLATSAATPNRVYSSVAPDVDLAATSLNGQITVTAASNAVVTLGGTASVGLTGNIPASVTGVAGQSQSFSTITPYLAMYYFIAVQGVFPSSN